MRRPLALTLLIWGMTGGSPTRADLATAEPAARAWAITEVVLSRHVLPPSRSEMLLAGFQAIVRQSGVADLEAFGRRVADVRSPDELSALLAEYLTGPRRATDPKRPEDASDATPTGEAFVAGVLAAVPYGATLMSEKERKVQESFEANLYVGVQVKLGVDAKARRPVFLEVLEGGPAENAGVKNGDLIEEVDGLSTFEMPLGQVVDRLRGAEGTDVIVRFRRPEAGGEVFTKPIVRATLPRPSIQGLSPLPGKRWSVRFDGPSPIGYLKITEITGSTPQEIRVFAEQLESEGVKALVLDLRETAPARFHQTVLLADTLLDGGSIGRVQSNGGWLNYQAQPDALFRGWPMVVLADGRLEPEIVWLCDALLDNQRATILGTPSLTHAPAYFETIGLPGGDWSVRIATGRLERGDGGAITGTGSKATGTRFRALDRNAPASEPLATAREILAGALGSAK